MLNHWQSVLNHIAIMFVFLHIAHIVLSIDGHFFCFVFLLEETITDIFFVHHEQKSNLRENRHLISYPWVSVIVAGPMAENVSNLVFSWRPFVHFTGSYDTNFLIWTFLCWSDVAFAVCLVIYIIHFIYDIVAVF